MSSSTSTNTPWVSGLCEGGETRIDHGESTESRVGVTARPFPSDHLADQMKMAARWSPAR